MRTCEKCVPVDDHNRLHRQWMCMCLLCFFLTALVAVGGVLALHWRAEVSELRQQLDSTTQAKIDHGFMDLKPMKVRKK